jgi:hypothetical protein
VGLVVASGARVREVADPSGRGQPAARVGRRAVDGPAFEGGDQSLAGRLLGDVDVTEAADQRGDHPAVLLAGGALDRGMGSGCGELHARVVIGLVLRRLFLEGSHLDPALQGLGAELGVLERGVQIWNLDDPEATQVRQALPMRVQSDGSELGRPGPGAAYLLSWQPRGYGAGPIIWVVVLNRVGGSSCV